MPDRNSFRHTSSALRLHVSHSTPLIQDRPVEGDGLTVVHVQESCTSSMKLPELKVAEEDLPLLCRKCHAYNLTTPSTKFCAQCGHRLRRKRKSMRVQNESDSCKAHGSAWFWGTAVELPKPSNAQEGQFDRSPPRRPFVKAHTAASGSRSVQDVAQLRRVSSFGSHSLLPALPQMAPTMPLVANTRARQEQPQEKEHITPLLEPSCTSNPCGLIWGEVLDSAIAEFESKKIILSVEIDSDERCMSILAQKLHIEEAARSKYVVASGISQLRFKYNELDKKVRMNKEKLSMVQQRLISLYSQVDPGKKDSPRLEFDDPIIARSANATIGMHQDNQHDLEGKSVFKADSSTTKKKRKKKLCVPESPSDEVIAAAVLIQKRFRVLRARRLFAQMVKRAYQRVLDPDSKQYFYYNAHTRQSQWEMPPALVRANAMVTHKHRVRRPSAKSMNAAASRIQGLYRRRTARRAMRELLSKIYEKVYDPESDSYYYYCSKTKTSSWEKPKLLRGDDVPTRLRGSDVVDPIVDNPVHDSAARKIQTLFRNRASRQFIRDLAKGNIEKHFDADVQAWYYFNSRTQQSFWEQPRHASLSAGIASRRVRA